MTSCTAVVYIRSPQHTAWITDNLAKTAIPSLIKQDQLINSILLVKPTLATIDQGLQKLFNELKKEDALMYVHASFFPKIQVIYCIPEVRFNATCYCDTLTLCDKDDKLCFCVRPETTELSSINQRDTMSAIIHIAKLLYASNSFFPKQYMLGKMNDIKELYAQLHKAAVSIPAAKWLFAQLNEQHTLSTAMQKTLYKQLKKQLLYKVNALQTSKQIPTVIAEDLKGYINNVFCEV